jgi:hypothetical protein
MYKIQEQPYGFRVELGGSITVEEAARWLVDLKVTLADLEAGFKVFVDMRTIIPVSKEAQAYIQEGQILCRETGVKRSVAILSSPAVAAQFRRLAGDTGVAAGERYVDASIVSNWEEVGMNWLLNAIDPDTVKQQKTAEQLR